MAENHRLANDVRSDTSVLIVMHIARKYADSVKGNLLRCEVRKWLQTYRTSLLYLSS